MQSKQWIERMPESLKQHYASEAVYQTKVEQGFELEACLTSPQILKSTYEKLDKLEKRLLRMLVLQIGYVPFSWSQLEQSGKSQFLGSELKLGLIRLRQKGIVFTLRKTWGEHIYFIPKDLFAIWQQMVMPALTDHVTTTVIDAAAVEPLDDPKRGMSSHIFQLMTYIAKNGLKLTQKGLLHKRDILKLEALLDVQAKDFQHLDLTYNGQQLLSPALAIIYDTALRLELIKQEAVQVSMNIEQLSWWLAQDEHNMQQQLYDMWVQQQAPREIWLQHASSAMELLPRGQWISVEQLLIFLSKQGLDLSATSLETMQRLFDDQWLKPLSGLGWIERGTYNNQLTMRWNEEIVGEDSFYIQPDFEIIVPPSVPYTLQWELACMAEFLQADRITRYRVTKQSIQAACEQGRTSESIINFLQKHAKFELPDHVKRSVEQWVDDYGKVFVSEILLLRCKDQSTAQQIKNHPQCASYIRTFIGEKEFLVESRNQQALLEQLEQAGFTPRKQLEGVGQAMQYPMFDESIPSSPQLNHSIDRNESKGVLYSSHSLQYYDWEHKLPQLEDVYPNLKELPPMWLSECRVYHTSTRKEMIERAIELQVYVKLKRSGVEQYFIPSLIQALNQQSWKVRGKLLTASVSQSDEISLSPDDWQEMQLILPGINDILD